MDIHADTDLYQPATSSTTDENFWKKATDPRNLNKAPGDGATYATYMCFCQSFYNQLSSTEAYAFAVGAGKSAASDADRAICCGLDKNSDGVIGADERQGGDICRGERPQAERSC